MPYEGGEASIFGFQKRGTVLSAEATARAFAEVNGITRPPTSWPPTGSPLDGSDAPSVIETRYTEPGKPPVVAFTVTGGGHTIPNPDYRFPRLMGRTDDSLGPADLDVLAVQLTAALDGPLLLYLSTTDLTEAARRIEERVGQGWQDLVHRVCRP